MGIGVPPEAWRELNGVVAMRAPLLAPLFASDKDE
jgi:hypothetical protein